MESTNETDSIAVLASAEQPEAQSVVTAAGDKPYTAPDKQIWGWALGRVSELEEYLAIRPAVILMRETCSAHFGVFL